MLRRQTPSKGNSKPNPQRIPKVIAAAAQIKAGLSFAHVVGGRKGTATNAEPQRSSDRDLLLRAKELALKLKTAERSSIVEHSL